MILGDGAVAVSPHQGAQIVDLHLQFAADIGIGDPLPELLPLENLRRMCNAVVVPDRLLTADEGLVGDDAVGLGSADKGVAGDAEVG